MTGSNATTRSYTVGSLTNDTPYQFKIRAVNAQGDGAESPESNVATPIPIDYYYALEHGGAEPLVADCSTFGTCCTVEEPCEFLRALEIARGNTTERVFVAVRARRSGYKVVLTFSADRTVFGTRPVELATYNEEVEENEPHVIAGDMEFRGVLNMETAGAFSYDGEFGELTINTSRLSIRGGRDIDRALWLSNIQYEVGDVVTCNLLEATIDATNNCSGGTGPYKEYQCVQEHRSSLGNRGPPRPDLDATIVSPYWRENVKLPFSSYQEASTIRGNVEFIGTTTIALGESTVGTGNTQVENSRCPVFENLFIAAGAEVRIEEEGVTDYCTGRVNATTVLPNHFVTHDAVINAEEELIIGKLDKQIAVWNDLRVDGKLTLGSDVDLLLIAPSPQSREDLDFGIPRASVNGSVEAEFDGRFIIAIEEEVVDSVSIEDLNAIDFAAPVSGDSVKVFVERYTGWENAPFRNRESSLVEPSRQFRISGSGDIRMSLLKASQAGVEIFPTFGNGETSRNEAGVLRVYSREVRGSFVNWHRAQTEFLGQTVIQRTIGGPNRLRVEVVAPDLTADAGSGIGTKVGVYAQHGRAGLLGTGWDPYVECFGGADSDGITTYDGTNWVGRFGLSRELTTGIYFRGGAWIGGDLILTDGYRHNVDGEKCYGGVYVMGTTTTTVTGNVTGNDIVHLMVNGNLTVHGDVDLRTASEAVLDGPGISSNVPSGTGNLNITFAGRAGVPGEKALQRFAFPGVEEDTLNLGDIGFVLKKESAGSVELIGPTMQTKRVALEGGRLVTNGLLSILNGSVLIDQSPGRIGAMRRGNGSYAYKLIDDEIKPALTARPRFITYTGSSGFMSTGDEIYQNMPVSVFTLDLASPRAVLSLVNEITVSSELVLKSGTLEIAPGVLFRAPGTLIVGDAYVKEPEGSDWISPRSGTITFNGCLSRVAENIIPVSSTLQAGRVRTLAKVIVEGCSTSGITLGLQPGYTTFGNGLELANGSRLDLNGNNAVMKGNVTVSKDAQICDSTDEAAGCGATPWANSPLNQLAESLEKLHYANTLENRAAFALARTAYEEFLRGPQPEPKKNGSLYIFGNVNIALASNVDRPAWHLVPVVIEPSSTLSVIGGNTASTSAAPVPPDRADRLTLMDVDFKNGAVLNLREGFDRVLIDGDRIRVATHGELQLQGSGGHPQSMLVVGKGIQVPPRLTLKLGGNVLAVAGDFLQGDEDGHSARTLLGGGTHYTLGDFYVGASASDTELNQYALMDGTGGGVYGSSCTSSTGTVGSYGVNLGLIVYGDYTYLGAGDAYNPQSVVASSELGLRGTVTFVTNDTSLVEVGAGAASSFCHVNLESGSTGGAIGTVLQKGNVFQNRYGELTLQAGIVETQSTDFVWTMFNLNRDDSLVGNVSAPGMQELLIGGRA